MKKTTGYLLLYLFLVFVTSKSNAQSPFFKTYNILKGSKGYSVNTIFQDSYGFLWVGTSEGLFKYNGVEFNQITTDNGLSTNNISFIGQDKEHKLWIGHKTGKIDIINENLDVEHFKKVDSIIDESISKIYFHPNGHTYITTQGNGMIELSGNKITVFNSETEKFDDYIYDVEIGPDGKLWLGTDIGILILDTKDNSLTKLSMKNGLPDNIVKDIEFSGDSILWVGMEDAGLARYNLQEQKFIPVPNWMFGGINHIIARGKNEIWASTSSHGLIKLVYRSKTDYHYKNYSEKNGIVSNSCFSLYKDTEANIWIAGKGGLSLFTGNLFEFLDVREGLPTNQLVSFIQDKKKRYWLAGLNGLYLMDKTMIGDFSYKKLFTDKKYKNHTYTSIYEDAKGFIWIGTYGFGLYRINPDNLKIEHFNSGNGLSNNNILSISGTGNRVWFATLGGGAAYCDIDKPEISFGSFDKQSQLENNFIYSVYTSKNKDVWFAKDGGGASVLRNNKIWNFDQFDTLSNVIYGISGDGSDNIWFTTPKNGIIRYNGKEFSHIGKQEGLLSNSYKSIIVDDFGNCVLAANEGISLYNSQSKTFENFGEEYGVAYLEPNLNAIFKDKSGDVWIATSKGILKYNPDEKYQKQDKIKIIITKKQAFYTDIPDSANVLSYDQNHIVFNYIGFWFKAPEKLNYRYRIINHDVDWNYAGKSLTATYSGLPPGKYTFQVQASTENDVWNDENLTEFSFQITPPFWRTWWFLSSLIIILVLGLFLFIRLRVAKLRKDKERLESEVQRRTAEIFKQKQEIETQKEEIELKNKNITDSILYASRIQNAVLPPEEMINGILPEYFILFKPRDIVSGDYYWLTKKGDEIVIAVADCTGHGVPGAFMSMLGVAFLNEIVNRDDELSAADILNQLRDHVKRSLRQTDKASESKDGMDIALCVLNLKEKCLQYAGAYNPLFIINKDKFNQIKADRMPIGIYLKEKDSFTNHKVYLNSGDSIYMFSDGYVDQFGGNSGKKFLAKNFKELIISIQDMKMQSQKKILNTTLEEWRGDREQVDDILVMGFRIP